MKKKNVKVLLAYLLSASMICAPFSAFAADDGSSFEEAYEEDSAAMLSAEEDIPAEEEALSGEPSEAKPEGDAAFSAVGGWLESIYAEIEGVKDSQVTGVSYEGEAEGSLEGDDFTYLVRDKADGKGVRIDIPGLKAGKYKIKVEAGGNTYESDELSVLPHDRSGYAHFGYTDGVGAYNDDGTLKEGAMVIYVTDDNKNTVTVIHKGLKFEGIGKILGGKLARSLASDGIPLDVRFIGIVSNSGLYESAPYDVKADQLINGLSGYWEDTAHPDDPDGENGHMASIQGGKDITLEGIGTDATIDGWGVSFSANADLKDFGRSFEARNLSFINTPEDALGMDGRAGSGGYTGDWTAPVERCWIHNNSFHRPEMVNAMAADKTEGDGTVDFKNGQYLTCSYNYFDGCHKTSLIGGGANQNQFNLTYHHNYFRLCDQRDPMARNANIHLYNNLFYMQSNYCLSARHNCYMFTEYNIFYADSNPMEVRAETGTGDSTAIPGYIKSYNDSFSSYSGNLVGTIVSDRSEYVENGCAFKARNIDYSKFDTDSKLSYIPDGNYRLSTSYDKMRREIAAYAGAMKESPVFASQVATSDYSVIGNRTVNTVASLPVSLVPGIQSSGTYAFEVKEPFSAELDYTGDNDVILVNEAGGCVLSGKGKVEKLPAGRYMLQSLGISIANYAKKSAAKFQEINVTKLNLTASEAPDPDNYDEEDMGEWKGKQEEKQEKKPVDDGISRNSIQAGDVTYQLNYKKAVTYTGTKTEFGADDITFGGVKVGEMTADSLLFSKIKYKRIKGSNTVTFSVVIKGIGSPEAKARAKELNAKLKDAFSFEIKPCNLSKISVSGNAIYSSKKDSFKFKLKADTGVVTKKGKKKLYKLKYKAGNVAKSDFEVKDTVKGADGSVVAVISGVGNFTGTVSINAVVK